MNCAAVLQTAPLSAADRIAAAGSRFRSSREFDLDTGPWLLLLGSALMLTLAAIATYFLVRRWLVMRRHLDLLEDCGLERRERELFELVAARATTLALPALLAQRSVFDRVALEWVAEHRSMADRWAALASILSLRRRIPFVGRPVALDAKIALAETWTVRWITATGAPLEARATVLADQQRSVQLGLSEQVTLPAVGTVLSLLRTRENEVYEAYGRVRGRSASVRPQILVDRPAAWQPARLRIALPAVDEPVDVILVERLREGGTRADVERPARVVAWCREALVLELDREELHPEEAVRLDDPNFSGRFTNLGVLERRGSKARYVLVPNRMASIRPLRRDLASAI